MDFAKLIVPFEFLKRKNHPSVGSLFARDFKKIAYTRKMDPAVRWTFVRNQAIGL